MGVPADDGVCPSLLCLDAGSLLHVTYFLASPRDLAALQLSCTTFHRLLQPNASWARAVKYTHGLQLRRQSPAKFGTSCTAEASKTAGGHVNLYKGLCQLLRQASQNLYPVRFVALYTDGGVDVGHMDYWADHLFIPNGWAPFCAKYSDNVNSIAVLKTGADTYGELTHRERMINCLKWVPHGTGLLAPNVVNVHVAGTAAALAKWRTLRLESSFCQMAARAAVDDPRALPMLRGLEGSTVERRAALSTLAGNIDRRSWYQQVYRLHYMRLPRAMQRQPGSEGAAAAVRSVRSRAASDDIVPLAHDSDDSAYVMDESAVRGTLLNEEATSSVAILHGASVSTRGSLSCPVVSGALLAGLLPPGWPQVAAGAVADARMLAREGVDLQSSKRQARPETANQLDAMAQVMSYECLMRATLQQQSVMALDDMTDAEHVFAACSAGKLPPWLRHVVMEHAEYIEFLPPHLAEELGAVPAEPGSSAGPSGTSGGGASGASGGGAADPSREGGSVFAALRRVVPVMHPMIWFRFKEHNQYPRRLSARSRILLQSVSEMCSTAADILSRDLDEALQAMRTVLEDVERAVTEAQAPTNTAAAPAAAASSAAATLPGLERGRAAVEAFRPIKTPMLDNLEKLMLAIERTVMLRTTLLDEANFALPMADLDRAIGVTADTEMTLKKISRLLCKLEEAFGWKVEEAGAGSSASNKAKDGNEEEVEMPAHRGSFEVEDLTMCRASACWKLQTILKEPPLCHESRQVRLALAAALQRIAGQAAAEVTRNTPELSVVETRNKDLLRRLPLQPPAPPSSARAAAASTSGPAASLPVSGEVPVAPQAQAAAAAGGAFGASEGSSAGSSAALAALHATLEPGPPAGWAAEGLFDPNLQADMGSLLRLHPGMENPVHRVSHVYASLLFPVAANAVVFKAIRPENLMQVVEWDHSEQPNVDVEYVGLQGRVVRLPSGVQVVPAV